MSECEGFEIAIDMHRRGALDAASVERLERHLESCGACRRYEEVGTRTERAMQARVETVTANVDWGRVREGMRAVARDDRKHLVIWLLLFAVLGGGAIFAELDRKELGFDIFTRVLFVSVCVFVIGRMVLRRKRRMDGSLEGLLTTYHDGLTRRIQRERWYGYLVIPSAVLSLLAGLGWDPLTLTRPPGPGRLETLFIGIVLLGFGLYRVLFLLPRLRRERDELGR